MVFPTLELTKGKSVLSIRSLVMGSVFIIHCNKNQNRSKRYKLVLSDINNTTDEGIRKKIRIHLVYAMRSVAPERQAEFDSVSNLIGPYLQVRELHQLERVSQYYHQMITRDDNLWKQVYARLSQPNNTRHKLDYSSYYNLVKSINNRQQHMIHMIPSNR